MRHVPQHADRSVAVCVTGQATRLLQLPLLRHLVTPNPEFFFQIIYVFGPLSSQAHFQKGHTPTGSPFEGASVEGLRNQLSNTTLPPSRLAVSMLDPVPDQSLEYWRTALQLREHSRIAQVKLDYLPKVINMWNHQVECALEIERLEGLRMRRFNFIINAREDLFFFTDIKLSSLLDSERAVGCDIVSGDCPAWGGLNMQLQVLRRAKGLAFLATRLKALHPSRLPYVINTEVLELQHAKKLGLTMCAVNTSAYLPVGVARWSRGSLGLSGVETRTAQSLWRVASTKASVCFEPLDIVESYGPDSQHNKWLPCYPRASACFVQRRMCGGTKRLGDLVPLATHCTEHMRTSGVTRTPLDVIKQCNSTPGCCARHPKVCAASAPSALVGSLWPQQMGASTGRPHRQ